MRRLALSIILLTALAGCNRAETVDAPGGRVAISIGDYRYTPQKVRVDAGRVVFVVRNEAQEAHNFQVRGPNGGRKARVATLKPGLEGTTTARLKPGTYTMYCGIGRHEELGEHGELIVK